MAHQVGVTADRRGEVAVARGPQPGVAEVAGRVVRLAQRPQQQRAQRRAPTRGGRSRVARLGAGDGALHVRLHQARGLAEHVRRLRGGHALRHGRRGDPQRGELLDEPFDGRRLRALVHAVQARHVPERQLLRDGLVGGDHEVLDQRMRLCGHAAFDVAHFAVGVEGELRLLGLERQRTAVSRPRPAERRRGLPRRRQRLRPRLARGLATGEDRVHAVVVQALVGTDRRAVEAGAAHASLRDLHLHRDRHPVPAGHQRARVRGERVGQHRLHRARHVRRGRALAGLRVHGRALRHVGGHVGDVHPHPRRPVREALGGDRVVEVTGSDGVDRERRQLPQVAPLRGENRHPRALPGGARGALHGLLEAPREAPLAQQLLDRLARALALLGRPHRAGVARAAALAPARRLAGRRTGGWGATATTAALRAPAGLAGGHLTLAASVRSATASPSGPSTWATRTSGVIPAPSRTPPPPRLRPLGG